MSALDYKNSRVQDLRRLLGRRSSRYDEGVFVVEGPVLVAEAVRAGWRVDAQFVPEGSEQTFAEIDPAQKHAISHRADAFAKLVAEQFG